jgi:hypothetical protein
MHARAWWSLTHSAALPPSVSQGRAFPGIPRLRLWDDAMGFGCETEPTTWTIFELFKQDDEREPVVREAVWQRTDDLRRLDAAVDRSRKVVSFKPTVVVRDAPVPASELAALLSEAMSFRLPVIWLDDMIAVTCDVGAVGFEFFSRDQPPAVLKLQWSWDKPAAWEPVAEWFAKLRGFLVRLWPFSRAADGQLLSTTRSRCAEIKGSQTP